MRDGVTIYTDIFRPNDDKPHPAIMAMSPYGKEIGSQWLDDTLNHAGIPMDATSGLQKFEGPDPAYWCNHGYAITMEKPSSRFPLQQREIPVFLQSQVMQIVIGIVLRSILANTTRNRLTMD